MSFDSVEKIANALLYEGYLLYPYRPDSIKNRQRWNFGTLYPQAYSDSTGGTEPAGFRCEFLIKRASASLQVRLRFLQLGRMTAARDKAGSSWEQGVERTVRLADKTILQLQKSAESSSFSFPAEISRESDDSRRELQELCGLVTLRASAVAPDVFQVSLEVANATKAPGTEREGALLQAFVSAHAVLHVTDGEFVSLLEPPEDLVQTAAACRNTGVFPVLAGEAPRRDLLLVSPIILYDYPQVAPESLGNFNDATEIDEMLTLRVMTLSDEEKEQMRTADPKGRSILERASGIGEDQFLKLHGAVRGLRRAGGES